jgi:hypothetical protein
MPSGAATVRLPNGCTGQLDVWFQSPTETVSFLDNDMSNGKPSWWLVRRFQTAGDPALCFPNGSAPGVGMDLFVAQNVRV